MTDHAALLSACDCCGEPGPTLAVVSDPFADRCYGLCRDCLAPVYEKQAIRLAVLFAARPKEEQ